jgi:hypothetical protein
MAGVE